MDYINQWQVTFKSESGRWLFAGFAASLAEAMWLAQAVNGVVRLSW